MRVFIPQTTGTRVCGQIALAHFFGIDLSVACWLMGHKHSTKVKDMVSAIRRLGRHCPDRLRRLAPGGDINAIAKVSFPNKSSWHWVAVINGIPWDGFSEGPGILHAGRITSYLPIT